MELNNIELPVYVLSGLFTEVLVVADEVSPQTSSYKTKPSVSETSQQSKIFLGNNKKRISILVNYEKVTHLPDDELTFLIEILSACKLDIGDVMILNIFSLKGYEYKELFDAYKPATVLLFGVEPASLQLPVIFPEFQIQVFSNTTFLYSPPLREIREDKFLKSKLWMCLKQIFSI